MSSTAKLYAFAALIFVTGAIAALAGGHWGSFAIFVVLTAMMGWITWRVDRLPADSDADQKPPKRK